MGNLVTNLVALSGPGQALHAAIARLTDTEPPAVIAQLKAAPDGIAWVPFLPWRGIPEPGVVAKTANYPTTAIELGLAVLSREGTDYLRIRQDRDPSLAQMPPEYTMTAAGVLASFGLQSLSGPALHRAAEGRIEGCMDAGRAVIAAFRETGEFHWHDWRLKHWGARAFGEEMRVEACRDGSLRLRFDSVNRCPEPLIRSIASSDPELHLHGAAIEEDSEMSVFFVSGDDGMDFLETHGDEAEMRRAYRLVYGRDPEPPEDDDPEP